MASDASDEVRKQLRTLFLGGPSGGLTDGQLLARFVEADGEAAASAFAALVERHGPMVLGVCRGVLGDPHAAEDASQATFLVLVRSAGAVRRRESVASWLFGVARRVAIRARRDAARRRELERRGAEMAAKREEGGRDRCPEVFDELERLPESLRLPIVLCDLEGYTQEQAAEQLRWTLRTFQRRLAAGRDRLRDRLTRRGLDPAQGAMAMAPGALPAGWAEATVRAALGAAGKTAAAGAVPAAVAQISDEVLKAMLSEKLRLSTLKVLAAAVALAASAGAIALAWGPARPARGGDDAPGAAAPPAPSPRPTAAPGVREHGPRVVEGRVVDPDGRPARPAFAWVFAHEARTTSPSVGPPGAPIRPDDRGAFRVELPAEEWTVGPLDVTILADDRVPVVRELPAGRAPARVDVRLEPGPWRTTEVVVTGADGKPVAGADYTVLVDGRPFAKLATDAEGRCRPRMPVGFRGGFRIAAEGFRPIERFHDNPPTAPERDGIRLRRSLRGVVRDARGNPAPRTLIGGEIRPDRDGRWAMSTLPLTAGPALADTQGRFSFDPPSYDGQHLVFASPDFSQVAVHTLRDDDPDEPLTVALRPARAVRARVVETPRDHPEGWLRWTAFSVTPAGRWGEAWAEGFTPDLNGGGPAGTGRRFLALLPEGRYRVDFRGEAVHRIVELTVPEGQGPLDLPDVKLATTAGTLMAGGPAAEIAATDLRGRRVKLADYRGKVVVLDFWGAWCGPCVAAMPRLMALAETFRGKPLAILALHDATAASAEDYKRLTARARATLWHGRDLPFPVLLDDRPEAKPGDLSRPAPGEPGSGVTGNTYEVDSWPSTFVIGRDGVMVGRFDVETLEPVLREQLGMAPAAPSAAPAPLPGPRPPAPKATGPSTFHGRVLGADGTPVAGATVTPQLFTVREKVVHTRADGTFALTLADPSSPLAFLIEARGHAPRAIPFSRVDLLPADYRLDAGATVSGRVVLDGRPLAGVVVGLAHADGMNGNFLGHWEATTDAGGRFRFPNTPAGVECNLFGTMRSLGEQGGIPPRRIRVGAEGSTFDAGDLAVRPAHAISGRVVFADGRAVPRGTQFQVGIEDAWDAREVPVGADGRFTIRGVPPARVSVGALFPTRQGPMFAPDGYRPSARNKGLDPIWPLRLLGRVERDIDDLVILFEPGDTLPSRTDPGTLAGFQEVKDGPLTGAPAQLAR